MLSLREKVFKMVTLTLYTTTTCPFCKMEKDWLVEKKVDYTEILVDEHPDRAQEMIEISGQMGVPFNVIDHEDGRRVTILGFDKARLAQELGIS